MTNDRHRCLDGDVAGGLMPDNWGEMERQCVWVNAKKHVMASGWSGSHMDGTENWKYSLYLRFKWLRTYLP